MTKSKMAAKVPEILKNGYNSFIIYLRVVMLVSTPMFLESRNPIWPKQILLNNQISCKSKMAAKMTVKLLQVAVIRLLFTPEL